MTPLDSFHSKNVLVILNARCPYNFLQLNNSNTKIILFGQLNARNLICKGLRSFFTKHKACGMKSGCDFRQWPDFWGASEESCLVTFSSTSRYVKNKVIFMSCCDWERVIHAFISSQLDFCNCLYSCRTQKSILRLQLVQMLHLVF